MDEDLNNIDELLKKNIEELQNCQIKNKLSSCLSCKELIECEIRTKYVNMVYKSMNSQESGGFEF